MAESATTEHPIIIKFLIIEMCKSRLFNFRMKSGLGEGKLRIRTRKVRLNNYMYLTSLFCWVVYIYIYIYIPTIFSAEINLL